MAQKLTEVIIEERFGIDPRTRLEYFSHLTVWADPGAEKFICQVNGVTRVDTTTEKGRYFVGLDPRYDRAQVIDDIEAAIKTNLPPQD